MNGKIRKYGILNVIHSVIKLKIQPENLVMVKSFSRHIHSKMNFFKMH